MYTCSGPCCSGGGGGAAKRRPFYVHPKEWLAGVAIFLWLLFLRVAHFSHGSWLSSFGDNQGDLFEFLLTPDEVNTALRDFCAMDIAMRCGDHGLYGCQQAYGSAITHQIGIIPCPQPSTSDKLNRTALNYENASIVDCSLQLQVTSIDELSKVQFMTLDDVALHGSTIWNKLSAVVTDGHILPKDDALAILMASLLNSLHLTSFVDDSYTDDDREAILENNLNEIIDLFAPSEPSSVQRGRSDPATMDTAPAIGTSKATRNGITDIVWSRNEILDLAHLVAKHQRLSNRNKNGVQRYGWARFEVATPKKVSPLLVERTVHKMITAYPKEGNQIDSARRLPALHYATATAISTSSSINACSPAMTISTSSPVTYKPKVKHAYQLFLYDPWMDQCMNSNFENKTLVTKICQRAMEQAPTKLYQLEAYPASSDFIYLTHTFMLGANLTGLLVILMACNLRRRYVRKMDEGKRRLEQELNDPFLRASLERKALSLPEDQRQLLFNRLEMKLQNWDSYDAASKLALRWVLRYRDVMVFILTVSVLVGLFLSIYHIESWAAFLENLLVSIGMWTLSYAIPTEYREVSYVESKTRQGRHPIIGIMSNIGGSSVTTSISTEPSSSATRALLNDNAVPADSSLEMAQMT